MDYRTEYKDCLQYIEQYWKDSIHKPSRKKDPERIRIPHSYVVPNKSKFNYIFYWDTFFIFKGLMGTKHQWIMKKMVNNFIYLFNTYGIIPNSNWYGAFNRSQPPFLSSMILDTYKTLTTTHKKIWKIPDVTKDIKSYGEKLWLKKAMKVAEKEYRIVWLDPDGVFNHRAKGHLLSRYGDRDVGYSHSSELESGWDLTSRFYNQCSDYLPIDLNVYLYKYELDFAQTQRLFKNKERENYWLEQSEKRKAEINRLMWNEKEGFFFDYNYHTKNQSSFLSLAGFTPLWAGLATEEQARKMVRKLDKFQSKHGLFITAKESLPNEIDFSKIHSQYHKAVKDIFTPKQWDYPNIWSPLEYLTVIGLLRYGYIDEAVEIMKKSVEAHAKLFRKYKTFFEKIDGLTGERTIDYHYENQDGFGWTNTVFYRYIQILSEIEIKSQIDARLKMEKSNILDFINIH